MGDDRRCTVLVVEDDPDLRETLVEALKEERHIVFQATNGAEALRVLEMVKIGLVLVDLMLPDINGSELVDRMQKDDRFSSIPVCVMSGALGPTPTGVQMVLAKPYTLASVREVIRQIC